MRYGLKTLLEVCINDGDLVVSITNNYKLTKGRVYRIKKTTLSSQPYVIDDSGGFNFNMSVFVFECDWNKAIRDLKLRKIGIS
jgi:hypothetical protein